ncbi:hypothetical protein [uncultured Microscilla sp.]|uniref:hypothetical protein n=1 Tax=uncultured Microscilla sp. TaxID=432653 RepID=UPI0026310245|nr:hypothetical protein [uncultured Microscilla sp.]
MDLKTKLIGNRAEHENSNKLSTKNSKSFDGEEVFYASKKKKNLFFKDLSLKKRVKKVTKRKKTT